MPRSHGPARLQLPAGPVRTDLAEVEVRWDAEDHVTLLIDGAESSGLDLADPGHVTFEYMQQMLAVLDAARPDDVPVRALHLGGAGCALPRAIDARRPGSRQVAVELDGELARLAREWFDLPRAPRLRIRVGEARAVVAGLRPGSWEIVVRDVFDDGEVPDHVRTPSMARDVRQVLTADGLYLVNLTDEPPLAQARAEVATIAEVFEHVALTSEPGILRGRRYGNLVVVASPAPLPLAAIDRGLRRLPVVARLVHGEDLRAFVAGARPWPEMPAPAPAG